MLACFRRTYSSTFIILDATELHCEVLSALYLASSDQSSYKTHAMVNRLMGIALNGAFMFISQFYTGTISDCQLFMPCGILEYCEVGARRLKCDGGTRL